MKSIYSSLEEGRSLDGNDIIDFVLTSLKMTDFSLKEKNHENILEIRKVINLFEKDTQIFLGGIPMIADDMISFIKNDIIYFGVGVFYLLLQHSGTYLDLGFGL